MPTLTELLDTATGPVEPAFGVGDVHRRVWTRRRRRWIARGVTLASAIALGAATITVLASSDDQRTVVATTDEQGVFSTRTDTVLVFDDGLDGVTIVDLDRSRAVRRTIEGKRPGVPYPLIEVGNYLVVGEQEVYAAPLDGRRPERIAVAAFAIPSARAGAVWVWQTAPSRQPTYVEVDMHGNELQAAQVGSADAFHGIGVRGGIAFGSDAGVRIWDIKTGKVDILGKRAAEVGDAHGQLLAWNNFSGPLHLTRVGGRTRVIQPPKGTLGFNVTSSRFSPDGKLLALTAYPDRLGVATPRVLVLVDVKTGRTRIVDRQLSGASALLSWSPDGRQLFYAENSFGEDAMRVERFDLRSSALERVTVPFGRLLSFVAVDRSEARAWLQATPRSNETCPVLGDPPSGSGPLVIRRTTRCDFRFEARRKDIVDVPGP